MPRIESPRSLDQFITSTMHQSVKAKITPWFYGLNWVFHPSKKFLSNPSGVYQVQVCQGRNQNQLKFNRTTKNLSNDTKEDQKDVFWKTKSLWETIARLSPLSPALWNFKNQKRSHHTCVHCVKLWKEKLIFFSLFLKREASVLNHIFTSTFILLVFLTHLSFFSSFP